MRRRWYGDRAGRGRTALPKPLMGSIGIVVGSVGPNDRVQLPFAQDEPMIEALAPDTAEQTLDKGIGLGGMEWRVEDFDADPSGHGGKAGAEFVIVVVDQILRGGAKGCCLAQLLGQPGIGRMTSDADVHNLTRPNLQDEEQEEVPEENVHDLQ